MKMFTPNMPVVVFSNNLIEEGVDKNEIVVVCTDKENVWACSCNIPKNDQQLRSIFQCLRQELMEI